MCEANAYLYNNGQEELILESVDVVKPEADDQYRLINIFNEQKIVRGRIKSMRLVEHKIVFEALT
ncbi:MAG: CooT family nickel-binding protein [Desulfobacterales bacterium]|nr:CooT family nickel-binding protein [Desulfobacterales bacterium]MDJ0875934.1 CooT family nickel-binding protein [Desulfobacterales bacterium]